MSGKYDFKRRASERGARSGVVPISWRQSLRDESEDIQTGKDMSQVRDRTDSGFSSCQTLHSDPEGTDVRVLTRQTTYAADVGGSGLGEDAVGAESRNGSGGLDTKYKKESLGSQKRSESADSGFSSDVTPDDRRRSSTLLLGASIMIDAGIKSRTEIIAQGGPSVTWATERDPGVQSSAQGGERKGSYFSIISDISYDELPRSGSVDSAIDVNWQRPRSKSMYSRSSIYDDPIPEDQILDLERRTHHSADNREEVENSAATTEEPVVTTPVTTLIRSATADQTVNAAVTGRSHPTVNFTRRILSIFSICIPKPQVVASAGPFTNPAFSHDTYDDTYRPAPVESGNPTPQPSSESLASSSLISVSTQAEESSSCLTNLDKVEGAHLEESTDSTSDFTMVKNDFLDSFDRMSSKAEEMGVDVIGRVVQIANFAAAVLDNRGGYLSIDDLDVALYVPPGAIPAGKPPQRIYIFVQGGQTSSHNYLTPCVHCGPSTLQFNERVVLTIPHCAKDAPDNEFRCIKSTSSGLRTIKHDQDGAVLIESGFITLTMNHFCGYGAFGKVGAKRMLVCVFFNENKTQNEVRIRVRLLDNTKINLRETEEEEKKCGFIRADMVNELEVLNSEKDVILTLNPRVESWEFSDQDCCKRANRNTEVIKSADLWRDRSPENVHIFPSKLFYARCCASPKTVPFEASLRVFQEDRKEYGVELFVRKPQNVGVSSDPISKGNLDNEMLRQLRREESTGTELLGEDVFKRLCELLDEPNPLNNDWHILPENLMGLDGYSRAWFRGIEIRADRERRSPTEIILEKFFERFTEEEKDTTLQRLRKGLVNMRSRRPDVQFAIEAIEEQLKSLEMPGPNEVLSNQAEHSGTCVHPHSPKSDAGGKTKGKQRHDSAYHSTASPEWEIEVQFESCTDEDPFPEDAPQLVKRLLYS